MIFSEDNYGRFEAIAFVVSWIAVGCGSMLLLCEMAHMVEIGIPSLRGVMVSAIAAAILSWLLPRALSDLQDVNEIVRDDHSPVPTPMLGIILTLSVILGAVAIFAYRAGFLEHIGKIVLPYPAITLPLTFLFALCLVSILFSWSVAWFVIFPRTNTDKQR